VRPLTELLNSTSPGSDVQLAVAQGAAGLAQTRAWLCALLPAELADHVTQALERNGELTVFTESSAWAGRLTLALAELRPQLAPRLGSGRVMVKVVPGGRYRR
jgi:predicted nucleic acid-binding Zn ribbon protein